MTIPVITEDLAKKIEDSERKMLFSRLSAIGERTGNPMGVDIKQVEEATLFSVKGIPGPSFNKIMGMTSNEETYVEEFIQFYKKRSIPFQLEIIPGNYSPTFFETLKRNGLYQSGFHTTLYGVPEESFSNVNPRIDIQEIRSEDFDLFGKIYTSGFGLPEHLWKGIEENNKVLYGKPGWTFFLAKVDLEPAATGVYYVEDQIATLAAAATIPTFRNIGCHSALTEARIMKAFQDQCDIIAGQAKFGSLSQQNMQKKGLQVAYTKAIWVQGS